MQLFSTYEACLILNRTGARMASLRTWYEGFWGHMKGIWVLFQMRYGSLICPKEWLSDRPKWRGMLADPGAFQTHDESGIYVLGLICTHLSIYSKILYPLIAQDLLFQMRYGRLICSKKWLSERPNWRAMFLRLEGPTVREWCENSTCFSLSCCHLAVS